MKKQGKSRQAVLPMRKQRVKQIMALFLSVLLIVSAAFIPRAKAAETMELLLGDVNGDNHIDVRDAVAILKEYAAVSTGRGSFTPEQNKAADLNSDGKVDAQDARIVLDYLRGKPNPQYSPDTSLERTKIFENVETGADVNSVFQCDGESEVSVEFGTDVTLSVSVNMNFKEKIEASAMDVQFACLGPSTKVGITDISTGPLLEKGSNVINQETLRAVTACKAAYIGRLDNPAFILTVNIPADTPVGEYTIEFKDYYMVFKDESGDNSECMLSTSYEPLKINVVYPKAEMSEEPKEKKLVHEDEPQKLVEPGTASGGTMQYAIGDSATVAPKTGWNEKVPEKADAGLYYVWAKAAGDEEHRDSDPACYTSMIVHKVSFKVAGGKWNDKTEADKVLPLSYYENEDFAPILTTDDFPKAGDEPAPGHLKSGSWDGTIEKMITGDTTFTFTYDEDPDYIPEEVTGETTFAGNVSLEGRDLTKADAFRFEITEGPQTVATAVSDETGSIKFPKISYGADDIGEHTYLVKQSATDIAGVTVDKTEYTVTVQVAYDKENAALTVNASDNSTALNFKNTFSALKPKYTAPTGLTATYGQTLADVTLPTGWKWDDPVATSVGDAGNNTFSATFIPVDTVTYTTAAEKLTITVKKAALKELTDTQKPAAIEGLTENGAEQTLLIAPKELPEGYIIEYSLDGTNWSTSIPTGNDAGEYSIQTRYVGDKNHEDVTGGTIKVAIAEEGKVTYTVIWLDGNDKELDKKTYVEGSTEPTTDKKATKADDATNTYAFDKWDDGTVSGTTKTYKPLFIETPKELYVSAGNAPLVHTVGSGEDAKEEIERVIDPKSCYSHFANEVLVDGTAIKAGTDFTSYESSTVIVLKSDYLDSLSEGDHVVKVVFDDGEFTKALSIVAPADTPTPVPETDPTQPKTGDSSALIVWTVLLLISAAISGFVVAEKHVGKMKR